MNDVLEVVQEEQQSLGVYKHKELVDDNGNLITEKLVIELRKAFGNNFAKAYTDYKSTPTEQCAWTLFAYLSRLQKQLRQISKNAKSWESGFVNPLHESLSARLLRSDDDTNVIVSINL